MAYSYTGDTVTDPDIVVGGRSSGTLTVEGPNPWGGYSPYGYANHHDALFRVGVPTDAAYAPTYGRVTIAGPDTDVLLADYDATVFPASVEVGRDNPGSLSGGPGHGGYLDILEGATLTSRNATHLASGAEFPSGGYMNLVLGWGEDTLGRMTVDGAGSAFVAAGASNAINAGRVGGTGELVVSGGGEAQALFGVFGRDGGTGRLTVEGAGSRLLSSDANGGWGAPAYAGEAGLVDFGRGDGAGYLTVRAGGELRVENTDGASDLPVLRFARDNGGYGRGVVEGAGSAINVAQHGPAGDDYAGGAGLFVGQGGQGLLTVRDGAAVNVLGDDAGLGVGYGRWTDGKPDNAAEESLLRIESGGAVTVDSGEYGGDRGAAAGAGIGVDTTGRIVVDGTGSLLRVKAPDDGATAPEEGGGLYVGVSGRGALQVSGGARAEARHMSVGLEGYVRDAEGYVTEQVFGHDPDVTGGGVGEVTVSSGGELALSDGLDGYQTGLRVGWSSGADGRVTVDGDGSSLLVQGLAGARGGYVDLGHAGTGALEILGGGEARAFNLKGGGHDGSASVRVAGPGSLLRLSDANGGHGGADGYGAGAPASEMRLGWGEGAAADLEIAAGGRLLLEGEATSYHRPRVSLAGGEDSDVSAAVRGADSALLAHGRPGERGGEISVGEYGTGLLEILEGGEARAAGLIAGSGHYDTYYGFAGAGVGTVRVDGAGSLLRLTNAYGGAGYGTYVDDPDGGGHYRYGEGSELRLGDGDQGRGYLDVSGGGRVRVENGVAGAGLGGGAQLRVADVEGGYGRLTVAGDGSTVEVTQEGAPADDGFAGPLAAIGGRGGDGAAEIRDGGLLAVRGAGADLRVGQGQGYDGRSATAGRLDILAGGRVVVDSEGYGGASAYGPLGARASVGGYRGDGSLTVEGAGARLAVRSDDRSPADYGTGGLRVGGYYGEGDLLVRDGGAVDVRALAVGTASHATGRARVEDGGTVTILGSDATGYQGLRVGGDYGAGEGAHGELVISGAGASVTVTGIPDAEGDAQSAARWAIGRGGGEGRVEILDGGAGHGFHMNVGRATPGGAGRGYVTVDGAGSTLTLSDAYGRFDPEAYGPQGGTLRVGRGDGAYGRLDVTGGGEVALSNAPDSVADIPILDVGREAGASGVLNISGEDGAGNASRLRVQLHGPANDGYDPGRYLGPLARLGRDGGQGRAYVSDGGRLDVIGEDSVLMVGRGADAGDPAATPTSLLEISGAGRVTLDARERAPGVQAEAAAAAFVGFDPGARGELTVEGAGSRLDILADNASDYAADGGLKLGPGLILGQHGHGALEVRGGGVVDIDGGGGVYPGFIVGRHDGAEGEALVTGAGSRIEVSGTSEGAGPDFVSGAGGSIDVASRAGSTGRLVIEAGGAVENSEVNSRAQIASEPGATGELILRGPGSLFDAGGKLAIGADFDLATDAFLPDAGGDGRLLIADGGEARSGATMVGADGALAIDGGALVSDLEVRGAFLPGDADSVGPAEIRGDLLATHGVASFEVEAFAPGAFDTLLVLGDAALDPAALSFDLAGLGPVAVGDEAALIEVSGALDIDPALIPADAFDTPAGVEVTAERRTAEKSLDGGPPAEVSQLWLTVTEAPGGAVGVDPAGVSAAEGDPGAGGELVFALTRTGDLSRTVEVDYAVSGRGATPADGADFAGGVPPSGTAVFAAGEAETRVTLDLAGDIAVEPDEGLTLTLSDPVSSGPDPVTISEATAPGLILNDDAPGTIAISSSATATEGDPGAGGVAEFALTRTGDLSDPLPVGYRIDPAGEAPADADDLAGGLPQTGTVTFAAGADTATLPVALSGDAEPEPDERFAVTLTGFEGDPAAYVFGARTGEGLIADDDTVRRVGVEGFEVRADEGDPGTGGALVFELSRTGDRADAIEVDFTVSGRGANPADAADFAGAALGHGALRPGEATATARLDLAGDAEVEPDEGLLFALSDPSASGPAPVALANPAAPGLIRNDDAPATLSIAPAGETPEGAPGETATLAFAVTRTGDTSDPLTVDYLVNAGRRGAAADADDLAGGLPRTGAVTFAAGEDTATVEVGIAGDDAVEPDESVAVTLTGFDGDPAAYVFGDQTAAGEIANDDGRGPSLPDWLAADLFGDPHVVTLDGLGYDFQAVGEFTLVRSTAGPDLNVQARTAPVEGSDLVSVITAMAAEVDGVRVMIDSAGDGPELRLDGEAAAPPATGADPLPVGDAGAEIFFDGEVYTLVLSSGEAVRASVFDGFMNVNVFLDDAVRDPGTVQGLLGDGDGDISDDFALADGSPVPADRITVTDGTPSLDFGFLYGDYAESWRISDATSLFDYSGAPGDTGTEDHTDRAFPVGAMTVETLPDAVLAEAEAAADAAGIADPELRKAAILDFALTGDDRFAAGASGVAGDASAESAPAEAPELPPTVGVTAADSRLREGDAGATTAGFTFYRVGDAGEPLEVSWRLAGEADADDLAGDPATSGALAFEAGQDTASIAFDIAGDGVAEPDERLRVLLEDAPEGVLVGASAAITTIVNDDNPPAGLDDSAAGDDGGPLEIAAADLLGNDTDPDGDALRVESVAERSASGAAVTLSEGVITYDPTGAVDVPRGGAATDSFVYTLTDDAGGTDTATVTVALTDTHTLIGSDDADDVLEGGPGDDLIEGRGGDDTLDGGEDDDDIRPGAGRDTVTTGPGADTVAGAPSELFDDTVTDFSGEDRLLFEGAGFGRGDMAVTLGSAVLAIDLDGDGASDGEVTLEGDFADGDFMAALVGDDTRVTFEDFLPALADHAAVDPALVNGVINQAFLNGDMASSFDVTLREPGGAKFDNVLGAYEIAPDGSILDARILSADANRDRGETLAVEGVEAGRDLGFFLVQDGAETFAGAGDSLAFVNGAGEPGAVGDGPDLRLLLDGAEVAEPVFHSFDAALNPDGLRHALSGVAAGGESLVLGFEDLLGGGDADYEDVTFRIEPAEDAVIF